MTDYWELQHFEVRAPDDPVKSDDELVCGLCDVVICDVEHRDSLDTLARTAIAHQKECPKFDQGNDEPARPTTSCGCGYPLIWVEGRWEHDAAPYLWGDDHDADEPPPPADDPMRLYWDAYDSGEEPPETEEKPA